MKGSVYKRGATWTAHIEFQDNTGKRRQRKRGGFRTEKLADLEVRKMLRAVDLGIAAAPDRITFGQYLKEWIDHREAMGSLERTTLDSYREKIRNYLEPMAGEIALQQLNSRMTELSHSPTVFHTPTPTPSFSALWTLAPSS